MSFVERHGLWSQEQKEAAGRLRRIVEEQKLEVIRLSFPDQHGLLRGKTLVASEALASLESGCSITTTMLAKDTSHRRYFRCSPPAAVSACGRWKAPPMS